MDQDIFRRVYPREYLKRFLDSGIRPDGRSTATSRKVSLTTGSISTAVGSAVLKLGQTTTVAGVQAMLVEPSVNFPEDGILETSVEILSTVAQKFRRVSDDALILNHAVRQWLDPHVDRTSLCVESGKLVWRLRLSIYCIDDDGNLYDAVLLAAVAALKNVLLPSVTMLDQLNTSGDDPHRMDVDSESSSSVDRSVIAAASSERTNPLHMDGFPLSVSFGLIDDKALIDPNAEEESITDARLTFIFHPSGDLRGVEKPGGKCVSGAVYDASINLAKERVFSLLRKLNIDNKNNSES